MFTGAFKGENCLRAFGWVEIRGGLLYVGAAVHVIMKGIRPKDFLAEVGRDVGFKALTVDSPGAFQLMKGLLVGKYRIEQKWFLCCGG